MWIIKVDDYDLDAIESNTEILGAQDLAITNNRFQLEPAASKDDTDLVAAMQKFKDISAWILEVYPYFDDDGENGALIRAVGRPDRGGQEQVLGVYTENIDAALILSSDLMNNTYIDMHRLFMGAELIFTEALASKFENASGVKVANKQIQRQRQSVSGEAVAKRLDFLVAKKELTQGEFGELEGLHSICIKNVGDTFLTSMKKDPLRVSTLNLNVLAKFKAFLC